VISYKDIALQILFYSSQTDYNCYRVIANFVSNFVGIATGINQKKSNWQRTIAHLQNPFPPIILGKKISKKFLTEAELQ